MGPWLDLVLLTMPRPNRTDRNRCILCGGAPTTKSHVMPSVIRAQLPDDAHSRDMITRMDLTNPYPRRAEQRTWERGANTFSVQPSVLCGSCNNGWMSSLEDRAAPLVAQMIAGAQSLPLDVPTKTAIAEWALAAAIVRGEVAPDLRPIARSLAQRFRAQGLEGLPVTVAVASLSPARELGNTSPAASSFAHDLDGGTAGHQVVFWLRDVAVVIATEEFAQPAQRGFRVIGQAVASMWPSPAVGTWPPRGSVTDKTLLRAIGFPVDEMPRQSFDFSRLQRGRSTIDAILLPGTIGSGPLHNVAQEVAARRLADLQGGNEAIPIREVP